MKGDSSIRFEVKTLKTENKCQENLNYTFDRATVVAEKSSILSIV